MATTTTAHDSPSAPPPARRRRKWPKRLGITAAVLLVLLVLLTPALISSGPGTRFALSFVNSSIAGEVRVDDLSVGWTRGQRIRGLRLIHPDGQELFTVDEVTAADVSLWGLLRGRRDFGTVRVVRPVGAPERLGEVFASTTPDEEKEKKEKEKQPRDAKADEPLRVRLEVVEAELVYAGPEPLAVTASVPSAVVQVDTLVNIHVATEGTVRQGGNSGSFVLDLTIRDLYDAAGALQIAVARVDGRGEVRSVPTALVDRMARQEGRMVAIFGPTLDASMRAEGGLEQLGANVTLQSQRVRAALQLAGTPRPGGGTVRGDGSLHVLFNAESWPALQQLVPALARATLLEPFEVECSIAQLALPLQGLQLDLAQTVIHAGLRSGAVALDMGDGIGRVELTNVGASIATDALGTQLDALVQANLSQGEHRGGLRLSAVIQQPLNTDGTFNENLTAELDGRLTDVSTVAIDQFAQQDGLVVVLLGDAGVDGTLSASGSLRNMQGKLDLRSQRLRADLHLAQRQGDAAVLDGGGEIHLTLTPQGYTALQGRYPALAGTTLLAPTDIAVRIEELAVPMPDGSMALQDAALRIALTSGDLRLAREQNPEPIEVTGLTGAIASAALGQRIDAALAASVRQGERRGDASADAVILRLLDEAGAYDPVYDAQVTARLANVPAVLAEQFVTALAGISELALGPTVDVTLTAERITPTGESDGFRARYTAEARSAQLQASAAGAYHGTSVEVTRADANLVLQPAAVSAYVAQRGEELPEDYRAFALAEPMTLTASLSDVRMPLGEDADRSQLSGSAKVQIDRFEPRGVAMLEGVAARNVQIDVPRLAPTGQTRLNGTADLFHREQRMAVQLDATVTDAMSETPGARGVEAQVTVSDLVVALVDQVLGQPGRATGLLGERVDTLALNVRKAASAGDPWWRVDGRATSRTGLDARLLARAQTDPLIVELIPAETFANAPLTPEGFAALTHNPEAPTTQNWRLTRPAMLRLKVDEARLAMRPQAPPVPPVTPTAGEVEPEAPSFMERLDPRGTSARLTLLITDLSLQHQAEQQTLPINGLEVTVDGPDLTKPIVIKAHTQAAAAPARGGTQPDAGAAGGLDATITASNLYTEQGLYNGDGATVRLDGKAHQFPVDLVDQFIQKDGLLAGYLGPQADGDLNVQLFPHQPGAIFARVNADYARLNIDSAVSEDRDQLTLRDDVEAHFTRLTQKMVDQSLRSIVPFLGDAISAEQEIRVHVPRENFAVGLDPYDISKVNADVRVELGALSLRPRGEFAKLLGSLQLGQGDLARAEITPINARIRNGKLTYDRFTMTIAGLPLGFQGDVDLVNERYNVTMSVPIEALAKHIRQLRNVATRTQSLEVPISGSFDGYTVDISGMLAQIARLAGGEAIRELLGEEGAPIGDLLDGILGGGRRQENPTQQPQQPQQPGTDNQQRQNDGQAQPRREQDPIGGILDILRQREEQKKREEEEKKRREQERR